MRSDRASFIKNVYIRRISDMQMKKIFLLFLVVFGMTATAGPKTDKSPQAVYIEKYSSLAVEEMYRSGVPASITLAQGLLESGYGLSELAVEANNHFGIKCHNWAGAKIFYDDDKRNECFRRYASPEESFRDHSDFLRYRDRYKFLFNLEPGDYKGWAHGLKKAGYATDPSYPQKLIRLIEDYELYRFDVLEEEPVIAEQQPVEKTRLTKEERRALRQSRKEARKEARRELPEAPDRIEQPKPVRPEDGEIFRFPLSRQLYSLNGVPFIYAAKGETYAAIAEANNLFLKEILKYNDLDYEAHLEPGTIVYLQAKKKQAAPGMNMYIVDGEDVGLWELSQRFGVKVQNLARMNNVTVNHVFSDGQIIKLRK